MKVITEAILRDELRSAEPETYVIPEGKILSPAAREYLAGRKIRPVKAGEEKGPAATPVPPMPVPDVPEVAKPKFVDYDTGAFYLEKPEHMTHLHGNALVPKSHPRILFRGKLDSLQALVVLTQCELTEAGESGRLVADLQNILEALREIMRCDVLDEPFTGGDIIGLTHAELRERSHNPQKFFGVQSMVLPDCSLGRSYALLNRVRTAVRETEAAGAEAFRAGAKFTRSDIIEELNRLSSAIHIMMCMYLAGQYK